MNGAAETILSEKTWIPLGIAAAALAACCAGAVWLNTNMVRINLKLESIENRLGEQDGKWLSKSEFRSWTAVLSARHPELRLPDWP